MNDQQFPGDVERSLTEVAEKQGNFYMRLGLLTIAGLAVVLILGVIGAPTLGLFTVEAAVAIAGSMVLVLGAAQLASLFAMRHTMKIVARHEGQIIEQAERHAELAQQLQESFQRDQAARDEKQDQVIASIQAKLSAKPATAPKPKESPFGDVHPVEAVEGIGPHFAKKLAQIGLDDTKQLYNANAAYVAGRLSVAPKTVENWQSMCELMAVKGVGPQYAELLMRAGIRTIDALRHESTDHLLRTVERLEGRREHRIQGSSLGDKLVGGWIEAANAHHPSAALMTAA